MVALPDRAPPELEPGVTLDSLTTVEACDAALDRLTMSVASIEDQLARISKHSPNQPDDWRRRTEMALRIKKLLLPRLQQRRADIARKNRQAWQASDAQASRDNASRKRRVLIGLAWDTVPDAMRRIEALARERHPDLFNEGDAA